ncbi:MAG: class I SAM-dependent methyltransferase [bacterium]
MKCKICNSNNIKKSKVFKPYKEKDWIFNIYYCGNCDCKFIKEEDHFEYHEQLHKNNQGPYQLQAKIAKKVADLLSQNKIKETEFYLKSLSYKYKMSIDFIKKHKLMKKIKILEIGSSTGFLTAFFRSIGCCAYGHDISKTATNFAKDTFGDYFHHDLKQYQNIEFDVIIFLGLIGCLKNPRNLLKFLNPLIKKNGMIFFNYPNLKSTSYLNELWVSTPPPDLFYLFSKKSIYFLLGKEYSIEFLTYTVNYESSVKYSKYIFNWNKNIYPVSFKQSNKQHIHPIMFRMVRKFIEILINIHIVKPLPAEYGMFVLASKK